jgi:hypothetical protein
VLRPWSYRLKSTRRQGLRRTYDVMLTIVQSESGIFKYQSWVHFSHEFMGNGLVYSLTARTPESAAAEAQTRIETNIETLSGLNV